MKEKLFIVSCVIVILISGIFIFTNYRKENKIISQNAGLLLSTSYTENQDESVLDGLPLSELEFDKQTIDLGQIEKDTLLVATFVARNIGTEDIVIANVNPDCTCTAYSISKTVVSPGDTVSIKLTFDTTGKRSKQVVYTTVKSNTPSQMYKLLLKADIIH